MREALEGIRGLFAYLELGFRLEQDVGGLRDQVLRRDELNFRWRRGQIDPHLIYIAPLPAGFTTPSLSTKFNPAGTPSPGFVWKRGAIASFVMLAKRGRANFPRWQCAGPRGSHMSRSKPSWARDWLLQTAVVEKDWVC